MLSPVDNVWVTESPEDMAFAIVFDTKLEKWENDKIENKQYIHCVNIFSSNTIKRMFG